MNELLNKIDVIGLINELESNRQKGERLNHDTLLELLSTRIDRLPIEKSQDISDKRCGTCKNFPSDHYNNIGCKIGWKFQNNIKSLGIVGFAVGNTDGANCPGWTAKESEKPKEIRLERRSLDEYLRYVLQKYDEKEISIEFLVDMIRARIEGDRISREHPEADMGKQEKPKEKVRVWECVNCKLDIYFDDKVGFYKHYNSDCYSCNEYATISTPAVPKPDSERWVEV